MNVLSIIDAKKSPARVPEGKGVGSFSDSLLTTARERAVRTLAVSLEFWVPRK